MPEPEGQQPNPQPQGGSQGEQRQPQQGNQQHPDAPWPANTPPDQMTLEQQVAFYKAGKEKWEGRAQTSYGRLRTLGVQDDDGFTAVQQKLERQNALEDEMSSEVEKAEKRGRQETQSAADQHYLPKLVAAEFRAQTNGRVDPAKVAAFLEDRNLNGFVKDGEVDTEEVSAKIDTLWPQEGNEQRQQIGPSSAGQGQQQHTATSSVAAGRELYASTHNKK